MSKKIIAGLISFILFNNLVVAMVIFVTGAPIWDILKLTIIVELLLLFIVVIVCIIALGIMYAIGEI